MYSFVARLLGVAAAWMLSSLLVSARAAEPPAIILVHMP
jgi:hypothetical protein